MQMFRPIQPNTVRFRAMMESGELVDEKAADIVQTQVIAHQARASIRNRDPVPLYLLTEEGRTPKWAESLIVETGEATPPNRDTRYCRDDAQNLHSGIRSGAVEIDAQANTRRTIMVVIANVVGAVAFLACAWLASLNLESDRAPAVAAAPSIESEEEGRVSHGPIESILAGGEDAEAGGEEAQGGTEDAQGGTEDAQGGTEDAGGGAEEPLEPGDLGGTEQRAPPDTRGPGG